MGVKYPPYTVHDQVRAWLLLAVQWPVEQMGAPSPARNMLAPHHGFLASFLSS